MFLANLSVLIILITSIYHLGHAEEAKENNISKFQDDNVLLRTFLKPVMKSYHRSPREIMIQSRRNRELCFGYCAPACCRSYDDDSYWIHDIFPVCCFSEKFFVANSMLALMHLLGKLLVWFCTCCFLYWRISRADDNSNLYNLFVMTFISFKRSHPFCRRTWFCNQLTLSLNIHILINCLLQEDSFWPHSIRWAPIFYNR